MASHYSDSSGCAPSYTASRIPDPPMVPELDPVVNIGAGQVVGYLIAPASVSVPLNATTYIYVNGVGQVVASQNVSITNGVWVASDNVVFPIAIVVTNPYGITSLTDSRPINPFISETPFLS